MHTEEFRVRGEVKKVHEQEGHVKQLTGGRLVPFSDSKGVPNGMETGGALR